MAAGAVATTILFWLWLRFEWFGPTATLYFSNLLQLVIPATAAWAAFRRAAAREGGLATVWRLIGAAAASWAAGQAVWSFYELVLGREVPPVSLADIGFLGFIPLAGAALLYFSGQASSWAGRMRALLDGSVIASALLFIGWYYALGPAWHEASSSLPTRLVNIAYPLADIVLATFVVFALARTPRKAWLTLGLIAAGLLAISLADSTYLFLSFQGRYETGNPVDAGWVLGFQLIGLAAVTPRRMGRTVPTVEPNEVMALVPLAPFLFSAALAMHIAATEGALGGFLFWDALLFVFLVVARQSVMLVDNVRLRRRAEHSVQQLEDEKRLRSEMLNNLTHDLLSPLSPVRIQLRLMEKHPEDLSEQERKAITIIGRNVDQVVRLGEDLKDVVNLETGHLGIDPRETDMMALGRDAIASFADAAQEKGIRLAENGSNQVPVVADPSRLTQVLYNLLSNALKFTPEGGAVSVHVARRPEGGGRVEVTDTGRGLTDEEMQALFRPFSQVHDRDEVKERGTGLGLFICKGIVEGHGGRIGVRSDGHGKGSTFWFTVP